MSEPLQRAPSNYLVRSQEDEEAVKQAVLEYKRAFGYDENVNISSVGYDDTNAVGGFGGATPYDVYTQRPDNSEVYAKNASQQPQNDPDTNQELPESLARFVDHKQEEPFEEEDVTAARSEYESIAISFDEQGHRMDTDWNGEYQHLYDRTVSTPQQEKDRTRRVKRLIKRFVKHCTAVAKAILCGVIFPDRKRLVQPTDNMGGHAGGEKYVVGKVLYKFARDWHGLYGSDVQAEKAAMLEVKVMNAVVNLDLRLVRTALTVLIRYRGHCVYCTAMAPILKLVYGSDNAGHHISDGSSLPAVLPLVRNVAAGLHVREHLVEERSSGVLRLMALAFDSELHVGSDNRFYLLDQARQMPPTRVPHRVGRRSFLLPRFAYLTRHFRPELLRRARANKLEPVSSDASSGFAVKSERERDTQDVAALMTFLTDQVMTQMVSSGNLSVDCDLSSVFHSFGVNMRYLPSVSKLCATRDMKKYLVEEMYLRCLKCCVRHMWNGMTSCSEKKLLSRFRDILIGVCNTGVMTLKEQVNEKYNDMPMTTAEVLDDVVVAMTVSMVLRLLNGLDIEYRGNLDQLNTKSIKHFAKSWSLKVDVVSVAPPDFIPLEDREKQLLDEVELLESANLPVENTLVSLMGLYRVWSEENPAQSLERGTAVAERLMKHVQDKDEAANDLILILIQIGRFYKHFGKLKPQRVACEMAVKMCRAVDSPRLASGLYELGSVLRREKQYKEALAVYTEGLEFKRKRYGVGHIDTAGLVVNVGLVHSCMGNLEKALEYYDDALKIKEGYFGHDHNEVSIVLNNIGLVYRKQGRDEDAVEIYKDTIRIKRKCLGDRHRDVGRTLANISMAYEALGNKKEALATAVEALEIYEETLPDGHASLERVRRRVKKLTSRK